MKLSPPRAELAAIVAAATDESVGVIDHLPDSVAPPCVLIAWADPWVKLSTLCAYEAAMEIVCVAQRIEPGGKLETLEEMVSSILPALKAAPYFNFVDVTSPYPLQIGGVDYLAASINLTYDMEDS